MCFITWLKVNSFIFSGRQRHRGDPFGGGDQLLREPGGGDLLHRVHAPRRPLQLPLQLAHIRLAQEAPLVQVQY